jgi:hypothetical protein
MSGMTMTGPHWQADIIAVLAVLCGVVSLVRAVQDLRNHRPGHLDVDLCQVAMSVLMALMLADGGTGWRPALDIPTIVLFTVFAVWFAARIALVERTVGRMRSGHRLGHLMMSLAMVYMVGAIRWGLADMSGTSPAGSMNSSVPWRPTLLLILLAVMCLYVVVQLDRISKPRGAVVVDGRVTVAAHAVMAAAMGYMLTMMLQ